MQIRCSTLSVIFNDSEIDESEIVHKGYSDVLARRYRCMPNTFEIQQYIYLLMKNIFIAFLKLLLSTKVGITSASVKSRINLIRYNVRSFNYLPSTQKQLVTSQSYSIYMVLKQSPVLKFQTQIHTRYINTVYLKANNHFFNFIITMLDYYLMSNF